MVLDRIRGPLAVREVPDPVPPNGGVVVRVLATAYRALTGQARLLPVLDRASPAGMTMIDPRVTIARCPARGPARGPSAPSGPKRLPGRLQDFSRTAIALFRHSPQANP